MIRADEQIIFFPTLARPRGPGRWEARLHGVLFKPQSGSLKRKLLVRAIARATGVRHDEAVGPRLRERLAPFLADSKGRRRIRVLIADQIVTLGPSGGNGHLVGSATLSAVAGGAGVVEYGLAEDERAGNGGAVIAGRVHLLDGSGFSVISDIDDTIKHSDVPDTRELLRNTFLRPHRPIGAIAAFHRALHAAGAAFHYVSASPWQLYPTLAEFLVEQSLPRGTFHLKTFRVKDHSVLSLFASPRLFKVAAIEPLLRSWPRRGFVLVGDSAELDPEIYGEMARRCPRQVAYILIRDITGEERGSARYKAAFAGVRKDCWEVLRDDAEWERAGPRVIEALTGLR